MKRVLVTKREARTIAKQIGASWIRANAGVNVAGAIERRFPDAPLADQMKVVTTVERALNDLADRLDPAESE